MLGVILLTGLALRVLYTWGQFAADPWFDRPLLDGRYYIDWATALAEGRGGPDGAFYLAPLYPYLLVPWVTLFGGTFWLLYVGQHVVTLATAALLAIGGRRFLGEAASLSAAALFLLQQPLLFFAARPLGETLAVFLLVSAVVTVWKTGWRPALAAGLLIALASTARPNLLLVALCWIVGEALLRQWKRGLLMLTAVLILILPVAMRNLAASGHLVPISSNGGLTAYHGNGPGARGIFTRPAGFSPDSPDQRAEATRHARARSGRMLDHVEADAWWGRQAWIARTERPVETLGLLAWRISLLLDNHEYGLDYPAALDPNPWRLTVRLPGLPEVAFVPWALLVGLAAVGAVLCRVRGSGGWGTWSAIVACAATPVLFYVSSRYRLPTAALLSIPAGAGVAALLSWRSWERARLASALLIGVALISISFGIPSGDLRRISLAEGLSSRAVAYLRDGRIDLAEADARRAVGLERGSPRLWINLGAVLEAKDDLVEAEAAYREALGLDSTLAEAAFGLSSTLIRRGRFADALPILRRALLLHPRDPKCWNNLVLALYASGDAAGGRQAAARARRAGVELSPRLLEWLAERPEEHAAENPERSRHRSRSGTSRGIS